MLSQSWETPMAGRHRTIPIFVPHLGCPQDCLFCNQKRITGQIESMTPEKARDIIRRGVQSRQSGDFVEVGFFGGSFTGIPVSQQEAFLSLAQEALRAGEIDGIRLSTRPDYIDEAVLDRLARFGVTTVELGAQSMDDMVLELCHRGHTASQTVQAAEAIKAKGFSLGLQMMIGLPGDSKETSLQTAEIFAQLKPQCVRIYPTLVIRDTALFELYRKDKYQPLSLEDAVEICADLYRIFSREQIEVIRMGLLEMEPNSVASGPFHPAFGELVLSRACLIELRDKMKAVKGKRVQIRTNPRCVSILVGQKRENIAHLYREFSLDHIEIIQDASLPEGEFALFEQK